MQYGSGPRAARSRRTKVRERERGERESARARAREAASKREGGRERVCVCVFVRESRLTRTAPSHWDASLSRIYALEVLQFVFVRESRLTHIAPSHYHDSLSRTRLQYYSSCSYERVVSNTLAYSHFHAFLSRTHALAVLQVEFVKESRLKHTAPSHYHDSPSRTCSQYYSSCS